VPASGILSAVRSLLVATALAAALVVPARAAAYGWPLKPFHRTHPIRGSFGDPRYHLGAESALSSFHFGVDIAARDGQAVYSVSAGYVHAYSAHLTVTTHKSREFGYWHVKPVVRTGKWVKPHQLIGHVIKGWGHVHFAESYRGSYKDPLRKGALTPYGDKTAPVIDSVRLLRDDGSGIDPGHVTGPLSIVVSAWDPPPVTPPAPWDVARLAPARVWWTLAAANGSLVQSYLVADFLTGLPPNWMYSWVYAPGTYQNKPHRPGNYLYWAMHSLDTSAFPDGRYQLTIVAADDRGNEGSASVSLQFANGTPAVAGARLPAAVEHR
jgi:murein DD-endopeptidase MepM/ murein hydrolase activator NlpD